MGLGSWHPSRRSVTAVRRVAERGPVVLVGASLGGTVITVAGNLVPDLVDRLVYISAWSCVERGEDWGCPRVEADAWGTIARSYPRLTDDRCPPIAMQDRMIAEADALTPGNS